VLRFHHVNLGVPDDGAAEDEARFLIDIIGYRRVDVSPELAAMGVRWYEADDGSQVHLSVDPDHRPAARAHVAVDFGDAIGAVEQRLSAAGIESRTGQFNGTAIVNCVDPSGNRWELRGTLASA
jgi:catechol 2,3-dioxygenase-like lactoylglutathione lyase family enzyme